MKNIVYNESDNLSLKTFSFDNETINSENDMIRNLKDENGRLMKLLHEKDFEINRIKRVSEKQTAIRDNLSEGAASLKIIELSKKLREVNSECESWKTKYYQKDKEVKNVVNEIRESKTADHIDQPSDTVNELKTVKDKLKNSENKVLELLTTNQNLSRDLKMATKVLENELGDSNVDITRLLANPGQWRGRAQKIVSLKDKVEQLERQLKNEPFSSESNQGTGATSLGLLHSSSTSALNPSSRTRQGDVLARIQRERQMSADKLEEEHRRMSTEHERVKQMCEGLKLRNKCLTEEVKLYKLQIKNMLEKTKNDDELIGSLILQQDRLKNTLQSVMSRQEKSDMSAGYDRSQAASQVRQDQETVEKLREIIGAKDTELRRLREGNGVRGKEGEGPEFDLDHEQMKISCGALESEVSRLRELLAAEDGRLEGVLQKNVALSEDNARLRQTCLQLDRDLQKVVPNHKSKSKAKLLQSMELQSESGSSSLLSADIAVTRETIESLQDELCLRTDKVDSLRSALEMMAAAKKDDMRMLTDIIDQTRAQFLDGVRKIKTQSINKDG